MKFITLIESLFFVHYYHLRHLIVILKLPYRNRCNPGDLVEGVEASGEVTQIGLQQ